MVVYIAKAEKPDQKKSGASAKMGNLLHFLGCNSQLEKVRDLDGKAAITRQIKLQAIPNY